jgi:DNA-binding NarL/FixJ family response regulator
VSDGKRPAASPHNTLGKYPRRPAVRERKAERDASARAPAPWHERVAAELRATGEQVAEADSRPLDLTPQELHIAQLVADGKTNKEIAAALFLSAKTIEYHLANTYRKLDIHSRAELARLVAAVAT